MCLGIAAHCLEPHRFTGENLRSALSLRPEVLDPLFAYVQKLLQSCQGSQVPDVEALFWAHEHNSTFKGLGHILSDCGSIQPCLSATLASMWRSFYGNFGKSMQHAPLDHKLRLLNRAVLPLAKYRMPRWPYQTLAAKQLDRTQTKMIGILLGMRCQPGDDPASFARRRRHAAAKIATESGRWSWRKSVVNWNAHLLRSINHKLGLQDLTIPWQTLVARATPDPCSRSVGQRARRPYGYSRNAWDCAQTVA